MKRFKFQFESLEKVRKARENEALRALSDAQNRYISAVSEKNEMNAALDLALSRRAELSETSATGTLPLQLEDSFIEGQRHRIARQDLAILRAKKRVDQAMRAYVVARRATRMIERLREKAVADYKLERSRWEQKQIDDLVVMRERLKSTSEAS